MKKQTKPALYLHRASADVRPKISRAYDARFKVSPQYRETLPDMMAAVGAIEGADVGLQQVGVSNFRLPLKFATQSGVRELEASIAGTVSLNAGLKGINMSRIVRTFYDRKEKSFTLDSLKPLLLAYRKRIDSMEARIRVGFSFPILQPSLRSGLKGWQFYRCAYEGRVDRNWRFRKFIHFDFVYSSACPCSAELAEHARDQRGVYAIPHSQRSKARVVVEVAEGKKLSIEELQQHCLNALKTETQVLVKREDEQAFAELNGSHIKFVEDAARLLYRELASDRRIADFQIACAHLEALHSHDAVSVVCKGVPGGLQADFFEFTQLIC